MDDMRLKDHVCVRCNAVYNLKPISNRSLQNNFDVYTTLCTYCRKYKNCKNCNVEFHHKQNQTCSVKCADELTVKSYISSCGAPHNFYKRSKSREAWENRLLEEEGIINVFQRDDVKAKLRSTMDERYGGWYSSTAEGKTRIRKIFKEKYGRDWVSLDIPEVYEKYVRSTLERWGETHWAKSNEGRLILSRIVKEIRNSSEFMACQIARGNWKDHSDIEQIDSYYHAVYKLTEQNLNTYGIDKFGDDWKNRRSPLDHHVDHVFPIIKSYYLGIPPELVANIENLNLIPASENLSKGKTITIIPNHIKNWINENQAD